MNINPSMPPGTYILLAVTVIHMLPSSKRYDWDNITDWLTLYDGHLMGGADDSSFAVFCK